MNSNIPDYVQDLLEKNADAIAMAADAITVSGQRGGLVRASGAGHSLAAVMETFFRAGGLAFVSPLFDPAVFPLTGARDATAAERELGRGRALAEAAEISADDTVVIFSNSGVNPFPVEIAEVAQSRGATVIAVTSVDSSRIAPRRARSILLDHADVVLDTRVPTGDVSWPPAAAETSPLSSIANVTLWTSVLRDVYDRDAQLPRWRSANISGNDEHNATIAAVFEKRVPAL